MSSPADESEVTLPPQRIGGPLTGAPEGVLAHLSAGRLCRNCKHQERSLTLAPEYKLCTHPLMPINLVTGTRKFPCVIARGYDQLCGYLGARWEHRD